ncbi:hypothetical protein QTP88_019116 [Uroleucon formosanum]
MLRFFWGNIDQKLLKMAKNGQLHRRSLCGRSTIRFFDTYEGGFWKCYRCNKIMNTLSAAISHRNRGCTISIPEGVLKNGIFMCRGCGIVFHNSQSWVDHEAGHLASCTL